MTSILVRSRFLRTLERSFKGFPFFDPSSSYIGSADGPCISDSLPSFSDYSSGDLLANSLLPEKVSLTESDREREQREAQDAIRDAIEYPQIGPPYPPWACAQGKRPTYCAYKSNAGFFGFGEGAPNACNDCKSSPSAVSQAAPITEISFLSI